MFGERCSVSFFVNFFVLDSITAMMATPQGRLTGAAGLNPPTSGHERPNISMTTTGASNSTRRHRQRRPGSRLRKHSRKGSGPSWRSKEQAQSWPRPLPRRRHRCRPDRRFLHRPVSHTAGNGSIGLGRCMGQLVYQAGRRPRCMKWHDA